MKIATSNKVFCCLIHHLMGWREEGRGKGGKEGEREGRKGKERGGRERRGEEAVNFYWTFIRPPSSLLSSSHKKKFLNRNT